MLLEDQIRTLENFGLTFHESLTPDFIDDYIRFLRPWDYSERPFYWLLYVIHYLEGDLNLDYRLCSRSFVLDLESYDRPTRYSDIAEQLAETTETRRHLWVLNENMTVDRDHKGNPSGNGFIEYQFQNETFRHEHKFGGDWLSRQTILSMASRFSSLNGELRFYGTADSQGLQMYYMLVSEENRIRETFQFNTLDELLEINTPHY